MACDLAENEACVLLHLLTAGCWPRLCEKDFCIGANLTATLVLRLRNANLRRIDSLTAPDDPWASTGSDLSAQHPPAQVARASSSPAAPMIAMTRFML